MSPAYARLRRSPLRYPAPAPKPGADTRRLLAELGVGRGEQERLYAQGIVSDALSPSYLPP